MRSPRQHSHRLFLDANVLFSAASRAEVGVARLWELDEVVLLTSAYALEEARRNLGTEAREARLRRLSEQLEIVGAVDQWALPHGVELPSKDAPILGAALDGRLADVPSGPEIIDVEGPDSLKPDTGADLADTVHTIDVVDLTDTVEAELPPQCPDGDPCDDDNACTSDDTCDNGECLGIPVDCSDDDPCTADQCNPETGCTNSLACTEGQVCTGEGKCCTLWECGMIGHECGTVSDECGGTLDCGECAEGFECKESVCSGGVCDVELVATTNPVEPQDAHYLAGHVYADAWVEGTAAIDVRYPAEPLSVGYYQTDGGTCGAWDVFASR